MANFGTFVLGTSGNENTFNAGIRHMVYLDHQSGPSSGASFPNYPLVIGTGTNAVTTMAPWPADLNAQHNLFDMGSGPQLPAS